jgi:tetratricopeptide (TPR) repeat protein
MTIIGSGVLLSACTPEVVHHNNAGNKRFAEGAYDEAVTEYRQAQLDEPDLAEPYYNAANAYNRQAQLETTLAQAQQALRTADTDLAARTWYNLGNAYFDAERWPEAVAAYQEALRIRPDDVDAKHNLELALQKLQEQQQQEQQQRNQQNNEQQQNQDSETDDQSQSGEVTPTPAGQPETSEEHDQATPKPSGTPQETDGLTSEQARQLLQAVVGDSETLQERLQKIYPVPGPPPERDW